MTADHGTPTRASRPGSHLRRNHPGYRVTDDCTECGPTTGPMTRAQRQRIDHGMTVVDGWLTAARTGDPCIQLASLAALQKYLDGSQSVHGVTTRMTGLVSYLARECSRLLPDRFGQFGYWITQDNPRPEQTIDDTTPEYRVSIRLMIAYKSRREDLARDLLLGYMRGLEDQSTLPDHLQEVFMCLTEIYLWIEHQQSPPRKGVPNGKHDRNVLAARIAAAWRRVAAAFTRA